MTGPWGGLRHLTPAERYAIAVLYAVGWNGYGMSGRLIMSRIDGPNAVARYVAGAARAHLRADRDAPDRWSRIRAESRVFRWAWVERLRGLREADIPDSLLRDLTQPGDCLRGRDHVVGGHQSARAKLRAFLIDELVREWRAGTPVDRLAREIGVPADQLWDVLEPRVTASAVPA